MFYVILFFLVSPLLFGVWCTLAPGTVPRWVLAFPLQILSMFWKLEEISTQGERRGGDGQILYGAAPERDPNYRVDQIIRAPGLGDSTLVNAPDPARVRLIGVILIAVWMAVAALIKHALARR